MKRCESQLTTEELKPKEHQNLEGDATWPVFIGANCNRKASSCIDIGGMQTFLCEDHIDEVTSKLKI